MNGLDDFFGALGDYDEIIRCDFWCKLLKMNGLSVIL